MNVKAHIFAAAIAAVSSGSSFAYANGGTLATLTPSAPFASSARGEFNGTRNSSLNSPSLAGVSLTNVAIAFSSFSFGALRELSTTLNRDSHFSSFAPTTSSSYALTSQMLAGRTMFSADSFTSKVSVPELFDGEASYTSNVVTPTGSQPETLVMLLASLGLMGAIALRRIKANAD